MAIRRGSRKEYEAKQYLIKKLGKQKVFKLSVYQEGPDYIVTNPLCGVEVKSRIGKNYTKNVHDENQWYMLADWISTNQKPIIYFLITGKRLRKKKVLVSHKEFGQKYLGLDTAGLEPSVEVAELTKKVLEELTN